MIAGGVAGSTPIILSMGGDGRTPLRGAGDEATPLPPLSLAAVGQQRGVTPLDFGAAGNGGVMRDAAIGAASSVLTSPNDKANWGPQHVGVPLIVAGAGAGGGDLKTSIVSRQSATQVTLADSASTTVAGAGCTWGTDDMPAFVTALNALAVAGGGTLEITPPPNGMGYALASTGDVWAGLPTTGSVKIKGYLWDSVLIWRGGVANSGFRFYNGDSLSVDDVVNVGMPAVGGTTDCNATYRFLGILKVQLRNTHHYAVAGESALGLVSTDYVDLLIEDSSFPGCRCLNSSVIAVNNWLGLTVRDSDFIDFGHAKGITWSKTLQTPTGTQAWIQANSPATQQTTAGQQGIIIENVRCDEGALWAIRVAPEHISGGRVKRVQINQLLSTVMSQPNGGGILIDYTDHAEIRNSTFGWTDEEHDAISLTSVALAELTHVIADVGRSGGPAGPRTIRADQACGSLTVRDCTYGVLRSLAASTNIIRGGQGGVQVSTKPAGIPADTDFDVPPPDGTLVLSGARLYGRVLGSWVEIGVNPTVPGAPSVPTGTAGDSSVQLRWGGAPANGLPISNYVVVPYLGGQPQASVTVDAVLSATISGLSNGRTYTFTVAGVNGSGAGPPSGESAPLTPTAFLPGSLAGIKADYDPDSLNAQGDGSKVASLASSSGSAPPAVQALVQNQPVLRTAVASYNGHSVLRGARNAWLRTGPFPVPQPTTLFVVGNILDNAGCPFVDGIGGFEMYYAGEGAPTWLANAGASLSGPPTDFGPHIHCVVFSGTKSAVHVDGGPGVAGNTGTRGLSGISLMALGVAGSQTLNGDLARACLYGRALTSPEKNQVGNYLATRYGLVWNAVP